MKGRVEGETETKHLKGERTQRGMRGEANGEETGEVGWNQGTYVSFIAYIVKEEYG